MIICALREKIPELISIAAVDAKEDKYYGFYEIARSS